MATGVTLSAFGVLVLVLSTLPKWPQAHLVGGNVPVDAAATIPTAPTVLNSPTLILNPTDSKNIVVSSRVDAPIWSCGLHVSFDGGRRWLESPMPVGDQTAKYGCLWPHASFGGDGTLYVSFNSSHTARDGSEVPGPVWVITSHDGGRTLSPPVRATGDLALQSQMVADRRSPNRAYMAWVQVAKPVPFGVADAQAPILVSRSDDGGATWQPAVTASDPGRHRVVMPSLAVGPHGDLYLADVDVGDDTLDYAGEHQGKDGDPYQGRWSLVVARSGDGGHSWTQAVVEPNLVPSRRFLMMYPPRPSVVADRNHGVHVAYHDSRQGSPDVWLWSSADGGRRWGSPHKVDDTGSADRTSQYLAQLDEAPNGRLDVLYYDRRADRNDVVNEVSLQSSFDHGRTFSRRLRVSDRGFDSRIGASGETGLPDLGDRLGLVATDRASLAMWADTRAATANAAKQDLTRAVVAFTPPPALPALLRSRPVGATALVLGLALAVISGRRRRPSRLRPAGDLPDKLDPRVQAQLGEDVREVDLHGPG